MTAYLLARHKHKRQPCYYYTDTGIDIGNLDALMCNRYTKFTIIGRVWPLSKESTELLCRFDRFGTKYYIALMV